MPTLLSSGFHPWLCGPSLIRRTAVCGPACTVVWEGRTGDCLPYPDLPQAILRACGSRKQSRSDLEVIYGYRIRLQRKIKRFSETY
jgi:hypothetical protein